jgi:AraC-like DNA-binding protein
VRRQKLGPITISRVNCTLAQLRLVEPNPRSKDLLILRLEKGMMRLVVGQEHSVLKATDLAVVDRAFPVELQADAPVRFTILEIRRDGGLSDFSDLMIAGSTRIDASQGSGAFASAFIEKFCEEGHNLKQDIFDPLLRSLLNVLDTALYEAVDGSSRSKQTALSIRQIKRFIADNLRDPTLNPEKVATEIGVSRRYLDELFKDESTTISRHIWSRRLESCKQDLEDPRYAGRRITEIAFSWGFNSASHFSRSFNERFEMSPSRSRTLAVSRRVKLKAPDNGVAAG